MSERLVIACDFDGVIHSDTSPWTTAVEINDPPSPGAFEWLEQMVRDYDVILFTCRLRPQVTEPEVKVEDIEAAIRAWFIHHGLPSMVLNQILFWKSLGKPNAFVYIDDRGYRFEGQFPCRDEIDKLRPYRRVSPP